MTEGQKRNWFDGTINIPTVITVLGAAVGIAGTGISLYNGIEHRVTVLEQHDETAKDNRVSVNDKLDKLNDKLDRLNDRLISNSAGNRPEMQRWSK